MLDSVSHMRTGGLSALLGRHKTDVTCGQTSFVLQSVMPVRNLAAISSCGEVISRVDRAWGHWELRWGHWERACSVEERAEALP